MKRRLAILLAAITLLTACDGTASTEPSAPPEPTVSTPSSEPAAVPTPDVIPTQPAGEMTIRFAPSATLEETVLVDENDVKITATALKYTAYDVKLNLAIENNSDKDLSFCSGTLGYNCNSVNGYMVDGGYLNADIAAGKKANETVRFGIDELTLLGFSDIADIELGFSITDDHYNNYLQTGPRQLKTSIADSYDYEADCYRQAITSNVLSSAFGFTIDCDSGETVFDQNGIRVISQTLVTNSDGDQFLLAEVENTSSDMVYVSTGDVSINGLSVQSGTWSTDWVSAGKRRVMTLNLSNMLDDSYREIFGLEKIGQITYALELKDGDFDTLALPQTLTLSVPGEAAAFDASGEDLYQEDGIRIVSKGLVPDPLEFSDDIHFLLLAENSSSEPLSFDIEYGSVSVNGYMTGFLCFSRTAAPGGNAVLDVELMDSSLEENGIKELEDITEIELTIEVKNDRYKTVAKPVVTAEIK